MRRELGEEALDRRRRRRDRPRERPAADLDRLPAPLGSQPAQPGDRPVSDAPLSWDGGRLDGTPWQGIRFLSIEFHEGEEHPAIVTAHLNRPVGSLTADHVLVTGGRRLPVPPYEVAFAGHTVTISFRGIGDHSPYAVELTDGGGAPLHPFFASAEFRFTIDCDAGDCRESPTEATPPRRPAADRRPADEGLQRLRRPARRLGQGAQHRTSPTSRARASSASCSTSSPGPATCTATTRTASPTRPSSRRPASASRCGSTRFCSASRLDDGHAPTTLLSFDVTASGFVPAGLQVRMRTSPDEVPVSFTVAARTRVLAENAEQPAAGRRLPGRRRRRAARRRHRAAALGPRRPAAGGGPAGLRAGIVRAGRDARGGAAPAGGAGLGARTRRRASTRSPTRRRRSRGCEWSEPLAQAVQPWGAQPLVLHAQSRRRRLRDAAARRRRPLRGSAPGRDRDQAHAPHEHRHAPDRRRRVPAAGAARAGVAGRPRRRRHRLQPAGRAGHDLRRRRGRGSTTSTARAPTTCTTPPRPTRRAPSGCASATASTVTRSRSTRPSSRPPRSS